MHPAGVMGAYEPMKQLGALHIGSYWYGGGPMIKGVLYAVSKSDPIIYIPTLFFSKRI